MAFLLDSDVAAKDDAVQVFEEDVGLALVFYAAAVPNDDAA